MATQPIIACAICTYNRYDLLPKAIDSVLAQNMPPSDRKLIVVDNSPDHDRAEIEAARYRNMPGLEYVIERIPGLSNARNVAARMCGTRYIAYLDDDAIASPNWLTEIVAGFEAFPEGQVGVVGGKVNPIWGRPRPDWLGDEMLGALTVIDWGGGLRKLSPGEWLAGANIAMAVEPLLESGGFATTLGRTGGSATLLSNEELQVLEAFKAKGLAAVYAPAAEVDHLVDESRISQQWLRKRMAWQSVSDFMKNPDAAVANADHAWDSIIERFNQIAPRHRTPLGFFVEQDNAEEFNEQLNSIYNMVKVLLAGLSRNA